MGHVSWCLQFDTPDRCFQFTFSFSLPSFMEISEAFQVFHNYDLWLVVLGLAILATSILPRALADYPLSMPIVLLGIGYASIALPLGLEAPDPFARGDFTEHLTELGVIIALMGAGLKIDRRPGLKRWSGTWRMLGITMTLTILMAAVIGWGLAAFVPATAMLFGAVISPTDPVLAADVQVGSPGAGSEDAEMQKVDETAHGAEDEVRFTLTSEAGLNDGLAFPFTNMAIAMTVAGPNPANWLGTWLLVDVGLKIAIALIMSVLLGALLARLLLAMPAKTYLGKAMVGIGALAATLLAFGATEYVGGYGFIATFVVAVIIRNRQRRHEYQDHLHEFSEKAERVLTAGILIAFGGALAGGLLDPLTWPLAIAGLLIVFVVRPLAGVVGLIGFNRAPWRERLTISFYGVRGIGSLYYLAYALNEESFAGGEEIWALVSFVLVISILVHGVTAAPVTDLLDRMREQKSQGIE